MSLWEEPVRDLRPLAILEREKLVDFLGQLTHEEWLTPTALPGWTVKDIALHLLDDDLTWLSTQRDGDMSGLVDMSDRQSFPRLLAQKNQRWVDGARSMSKQVVTALLTWTGEQVDAFHATLDLLAESRVSWASDGPVPSWFNVAQEFTERWVHQQQMREAVDHVADHMSTLPDVLRTFVWAIAHQLPHVAAVSGVELTIDGVQSWTLTPNPMQGWSLSTGQASEADARLRLTADAAWRLLTGAAVPDGGITSEGPPGIIDGLKAVRAIIV